MKRSKLTQSIFKAWVVTGLTILGLLSVSTSNAQAAPLTQGYYDLSDSLVPSAVRTAAASVFKIFLLSIEKPANQWDLAAYDAAGVSIEAHVRKSKLDAEIEAIVLWQVQNCRTHKVKVCDIHTPSGSGSGFLLGDGRSLWTDYHVIGSFTEEVAAKFKRPEWMAFMNIGIQNLPIFVFNAQKKIVFVGGFDTGATAKVVEGQMDNNVLRHLRGEYETSSDFVNIQLSQSIGKPLMAAAQPALPGEAIFAIGFPTGTGPNRTLNDPKYDNELITRAPYPDSTGKKMHVSVGVALDGYDGFNVLYKNKTGTDLDPMQYAHLLIESMVGIDNGQMDFSQVQFAQIDAIFGNSGGPILNSKGEVLGLAGSVFVENIGGKYSRSILISASLPRILELLETIRNLRKP